MYVVNKADRDGAEQVRRELRTMISLADRPEGAWKPPIVLTVAQAGQGVDEVVAAIDEHRAWMESTGELDRRRVRRARDEIEAIAVTALRERWGDVHAAHRARRPRRAGGRPARPTPTGPPTSLLTRSPSVDTATP